MADDEAQIRALLADMEAGYHAKDARRVAAAYAPGIVMYDLAPPLRTRRGEKSEIGGGRTVDMTTAEGIQAWMDGFGDAAFEYETRDLEVAVGGDVAFAHGLARMGSPGVFSLWFRETYGLRKTDGRWRITHIHGSVPFYMDEASKAALDLRP
jgi:ketosteroid isomerase-like protein